MPVSPHRSSPPRSTTSTRAISRLTSAALALLGLTLLAVATTAPLLLLPADARPQSGESAQETTQKTAQDPAPRTARPPQLPPLPVPKPAFGELPPRPRVIQESLLIPDAGRVAWSVQGDHIAFDRKGKDGYYDIYLASPEGANERCLTCPLLETRNSHAVDPQWHPSGQWVAFRVQPRSRALGMGAAEFTTPLAGLHTELWAMRRDGSAFYRLTRTGQGSTALLGPVFSYEGDHLAFAERVSNRRGRWGEWVIRVARFELRRGVPSLSGIDSHQPGSSKLFLEIHGFTPDDRGLIISGNLEAGAAETGRDLYRYDLLDRTAHPLTRSRGEADAEGRLSPDGRWLAFSTNRNLPPGQRRALGRFRPDARPEPRDLWLVYLGDDAENRGGVSETDGDTTFEPQPLTFFNHPAHHHAQGGVVVDSFAWAPADPAANVSGEGLAEGTLLVHAVTDLLEGEEGIWRLQLDLTPPAPPASAPLPGAESLLTADPAASR